MGKEYTTKSTKICTPRKFLRVRYYKDFDTLWLFTSHNVTSGIGLHALVWKSTQQGHKDSQLEKITSKCDVDFEQYYHG